MQRLPDLMRSLPVYGVTLVRGMRLSLKFDILANEHFQPCTTLWIVDYAVILASNIDCGA